MNGFDFNWWSIITIAGPVVLVIAIVWAIRHNRTTPAEDARSEQATRERYDEQARDDGMHPERNH